jgi:hypothetical protein
MGTYENPDADASTLYNEITGWDNISADEYGVCSHSGLSTEAYISGPTGSGDTTDLGWGTVTSVPISDGDFWMSGQVWEDCSCAGSVYGGSGMPVGVSSFNDNYELVYDYHDLSGNYQRCFIGNCGNVRIQFVGDPAAAYVRAHITRVYFENHELCFGGSPLPISSCSP